MYNVKTNLRLTTQSLKEPIPEDITTTVGGHIWLRNRAGITTFTHVYTGTWPGSNQDYHIATIPEKFRPYLDVVFDIPLVSNGRIYSHARMMIFASNGYVNISVGDSAQYECIGTISYTCQWNPPYIEIA